MKKILFGLLTLGFSTQAFAMNEVYDLCDRQSFSSDRRQCYRIAEGAAFDSQALNLCARMSFSSNQNQCLSNIKNKRYQHHSIRYCGGNAFDSDVNRCLASSGRTLPRYVQPGDVVAPIILGAILGLALEDALNNDYDRYDRYDRQHRNHHRGPKVDTRRGGHNKRNHTGYGRTNSGKCGYYSRGKFQNHVSDRKCR